MALTKEYFDKQFESLGNQFVAKEYFDKQFKTLGDKFVTKEYFDQHLASEFQKNLEPIREDIRDIKNDVLDIKETVVRIDKRDLEDSNALAKLYLNHDKRLKILENK